MDKKAIATAQDQTKAVIKYMSIDYLGLSGTPEARDIELAGWIPRVEADILPALESHAGFSGYLVAASIHLQMLQERANLMQNQKGRYVHTGMFCSY